MSEWIGWILDLLLIFTVGAGVVQAVRLIRQLRDLRAGRVEMERFVREFNGAVIRAEAGIKGLRAAARDSGDDLEKLVEKAVMIRDELNFIVESADSVAERLSVAASAVLATERAAPPAKAEEPKPAPMPAASSALPPSPPSAPSTMPDAPASRAEKELWQALQKLK